MLAASLLLTIAGDLIALLAPTAGLFLLGRALVGIALGSILAASFAAAARRKAISQVSSARSRL